ncbi:MAG: vWA domain-containing protein [Candidatus Binatus sp.]|uniref:vWA domain-containing protein n=1 Tax=Candidatus Binatus sp. TaxID=2811406 RepID=UPI003C758651
MVGAACSHKQLVAGGPAPGAGPEFTGESEQPAPEIPPQAGNSQPGYIFQLKRKGLDVALVIPRSGGSLGTLNEMKAKLTQLVESIHRLVPIARVGIVIYDVEAGKIATVAMTDSLPVMLKSLAAIDVQRSPLANDDVPGALRAAVRAMDWSPKVKRVIVLVADTAIGPKEAPRMVEIARKFHAAGGIVNIVDALPDSEPGLQSTKATREALNAVAAAGGGSVKSLRKETPASKKVPVWSYGPIADRA